MQNAYAIFEVSHNPALIRPTKIGEIAAREDAEAFLEERGVVVICFELDNGHDAADLAGAKGSQLLLYTVERI